VSGPAEGSTPWDNELAAAFLAPQAPEAADDAVAEGPDEGPRGESSPNAASGKTDLGELFARKSVAHPTVKALLERHHPVNARALSRELNEFADQLGLSRPQE
jgi:hypothetical protein